MTDTNQAFLADLLRRTDLFSGDVLARILRSEREAEESLTDLVCRVSGAREEDYLRRVGDLLGMEFVSLAGREPPPGAVAKLPARAAFQYAVAPVDLDDGALTVAGNDPLNTVALDGLRLASGCRIRLVLATGEDLRKASRRYYGVGADTVQSMIEDGRYEVEGEIQGKHDLGDMGQEASIVRFVNQIIVEADRQDATDIHFEPMEDELRIRYRVDGVLHKVDVPPQLNRLQSAIISRLKVMANMDIAEKRMPMDGRIGIRLQQQEMDIRVSTMPTVYGESVSLRLLQKSENFVRLPELGMSPAVQSHMEKIIRRPNGIVLVTGPTGSGKTTSLYAFLHEINTVNQRILTAEEPIEYEMPGINQVLVRPDIGLTFARVLRSFLRQDPDIVMVGEIRDVETAEIAINASLTGHLVFSTLHTNDAAGAFARLVDMGVEPFLVASAVASVMAQRLVRKLCVACRRETELDPALREGAGCPSGGQRDGHVFAAEGCENCGRTGYRGRCGIFELLPVNDGIESLVINRRPTGEIRQQAVADGMQTLRDDGWEKMLRGITTLEEILRVTDEEG